MGYKALKCVLLLFILTFTHLPIEAATDEQLRNFHVFTVASHVKSGLERTLQSAKRYGINVSILGLGNPYRGNGEKLIHCKQFISDKADSDIVLFVDGYDILFCADASTILDTFLVMNVPFVVSAEKKCFPFTFSNQFPPSPTKLRFINTGSFIGYVGHIRKVLAALEPIIPTECDQKQVIAHFVKDQSLYTLDYHAKLFLPLMGIGPGSIAIDKEKRWFIAFLLTQRPAFSMAIAKAKSS